MSYFLVILISIFGFFKKKTDAEIAASYAKQAAELFAEAKYGAGIILLDKAAKLDSANIAYQCQAAYGYMMVREFRNAESRLHRLQYSPGATDQVYQMLGRLYAVQSDNERAEHFLRKGIREFPGSGSIWLELGAMQQRMGDEGKAAESWKKGIEADSGFASNYYWLSRYYYGRGELLWAMLYAEVFAMLERDTYRSAQLGRDIIAGYEAAFRYRDDNPSGAKFMDRPPVEAQEGISFEKRFAQTMQLARPVTELGDTPIEVFYGISDIRFDFVEFWHEQRIDKQYNFPLFSFLDELYQLGFWDAYHVWMLLRWNDTEYKLWSKQNKGLAENFSIWFSGVKLDVNLCSSILLMSP
jgi:tetratricopeptide (TPR) repeat protein